MKYLLKSALYIVIFTLGLVSTANATLESRLGGLAVYDTDRDISWLADANFAQTSGFVADGQMNWTDANTWAAGLNVGGVTGWRLPTTPQPDTSCNIPNVQFGIGYGCTASEMGHLFYDELGGTATTILSNVINLDTTFFSNIQMIYWSSTEWAQNPNAAWNFRFNTGRQLSNLKFARLYAWAVHDGDVGTVEIPVTGTIILMSLCLAGLLGYRLHRLV